MEALRKVQTENVESDKAEESLNEDRFFSLLEALPDELAQRWEKEYSELKSDEYSNFFVRFQEFLKQRKLALEGEIHIVPGTEGKIVNEIMVLRDKIRQTYLEDKPESFLGEGRTAKVHIHPEAPHICIKYIKNVKTYTETDIPLLTEFERLEKLQDTEVSGVRTPTPYFESINVNGDHYYGMEVIGGNTLHRIITKPEENIELIELAKSLDRDQAEIDLVNYIKAVHKKFKLTHGDLDDINIMLSPDGYFYVIDLGKSKQEELGENHEMYREDDVNRVREAVRHFFKVIDNL